MLRFSWLLETVAKSIVMINDVPVSVPSSKVLSQQQSADTQAEACKGSCSMLLTALDVLCR